MNNVFCIFLDFEKTHKKTPHGARHSYLTPNPFWLKKHVTFEILANGAFLRGYGYFRGSGVCRRQRNFPGFRVLLRWVGSCHHTQLSTHRTTTTCTAPHNYPYTRLFTQLKYPPNTRSMRNVQKYMLPVIGPKTLAGPTRFDRFVTFSDPATPKTADGKYIFPGDEIIGKNRVDCTSEKQTADLFQNLSTITKTRKNKDPRKPR